MARFTVAISDNRHSSYAIERRLLAEADINLKILNCVTEEDMLRDCADVDGILLDMAPASAKVIEGLNRCKVITRYGVGYDNVDVDACTKKGIRVTNVPDYCAEDVSDHAVALLFACLRNVPLRDRLVRQGLWNIHYGTSVRVAGKTLGILGAGRIARAFIHKMSGFCLGKVLVYDPYVPSDVITSMGAEKADMQTVLREADFLSLHMPVTSETRGIINANALSLMKPTAILINTGRGQLIDDSALVDALQNGKIGFAGLDTHNSEPLPKDSPYFALDNVVLTDHTAYNTEEAVVELKTKAVQNVITVLNGQIPVYCINKF